MRLGLFFVMVLALCGCTKRILVHVPVTPGMSQKEIKAAEKEAVAEEKRVQESARWMKEQTRWKQQFVLSCPLGGYDKVIVHPALGSQYLYWKGGGSMKVIFRRYVMVHRVKNPYTNIAPDITNGGEKVISGLCPGGSITLVASIPPITGGRSMQVIWTAEGIVDGRLAYDESSPGYIWQGGYNWETQMNRHSWVIRLDRVDRRF